MEGNTPPYCQKATDNNFPLNIKELVQEKQRARRVWQRTRDPYEGISADSPLDSMLISKASKMRPLIITSKIWNPMTIHYGELPRNSKDQRLQFLH
jgi:hypothetical protein